jgi:hypothetical protein
VSDRYRRPVMFKLECKFDAKDLEKAIMQTAAESITEKVRSIRCPEHGQHAKIVARGRSSKNLTFDVSGCCEKLISEVQAKLGGR